MASAPFSTRRRSMVQPGYSGPRIIFGHYEARSPDDPTKTWYNQGYYPDFQPSNQPLLAKLCIDEKHGRSPRKREGGPLKLIEYSLRYDPSALFGSGTHHDRYDLLRYIGGFRAPDPSEFGSFWSSITSNGYQNAPTPTFGSSFPSADALGTAAWRAAKPKLEKASAFVFSAELRDLPGMLQTSAQGFKDYWSFMSNRSMTSPIMSPKAAADHFLNHQFGWKPFLGDLSKFSEVLPNMDSHIRQISDSNGKFERRRVSLISDATSTELSNESGFHTTGNLLPDGPIMNCFRAVPTRVLTEDVKTNVSAIGKFRFYRPEFDRSQSNYQSAWASAQRQLTVLGARISPINLYKIYPWSWAVDWITNASDYLEYVSDSLIDSLAAEYFYVTVYQHQVRTLFYTLPLWSGTVYLSFSRSVKSIERVEGNSPFDFSLTWRELSSRQLAIAGALGISRR